jgi:hypothetical protein
MMHLAQGLSTIDTRRTKSKQLTKAQEQRLRLDCKEYNRRLRQQHRHNEQLTLPQYINHIRGKVPVQQEFVNYTPKQGYHRGTPEYPSLDTRTGVASAKQSPRYTGTLIKGIMVSHKSNLLPVIDDDQIVEITRMRR